MPEPQTNSVRIEHGARPGWGSKVTKRCIYTPTTAPVVSTIQFSGQGNVPADPQYDVPTNCFTPNGFNPAIAEDNTLPLFYQQNNVWYMVPTATTSVKLLITTRNSNGYATQAKLAEVDANDNIVHTFGTLSVSAADKALSVNTYDWVTRSTASTITFNMMMDTNGMPNGIYRTTGPRGAIRVTWNKDPSGTVQKTYGSNIGQIFGVYADVMSNTQVYADLNIVRVPIT